MMQRVIACLVSLLRGKLEAWYWNRKMRSIFAAVLEKIQKEQQR